MTWSDKVKQKDGYKCAICGSTEDLQAHHIKPTFLYPECRNDIDNGITLCVNCHQRQHGGNYAGSTVLPAKGIDPDPEGRMTEYVERRQKDAKRRKHIVWATNKDNWEIVLEAATKAGQTPNTYIAEAVSRRLESEGFVHEKTLLIPPWEMNTVLNRKK